jgi:hypothetical protein
VLLDSIHIPLHDAVRLRVPWDGARLAHSQVSQHLLHKARLEVTTLVIAHLSRYSQVAEKIGHQDFRHRRRFLVGDGVGLRALDEIVYSDHKVKCLLTIESCNSIQLDYGLVQYNICIINMFLFQKYLWLLHFTHKFSYNYIKSEITRLIVIIYSIYSYFDVHLHSYLSLRSLSCCPVVFSVLRVP